MRWLRLISAIVLAKFKKRLSIFDESNIAFRVWVTDVDAAIMNHATMMTIMEMGRVEMPGPVRKSETGTLLNDVMNPRINAAAIPARMLGSTTSKNARSRFAPKLTAASSTAGSSKQTDANTCFRIAGNPCPWSRPRTGCSTTLGIELAHRRRSVLGGSSRLRSRV